MRLIRLLKNDIARESAEWVEEGVITRSQAEKICARYDVSFDQTHHQSFAYNVLVGLGFLFIGLALIVLIGENWEEIPRFVRMGGLIALTLLTHMCAIRFYLKGNVSRSTGLFFLANLFYGASIILIAQIYHLGEHMPDGVFWWALGTLPFGILLNSTWLSLQTLVLAAIWAMLEVSLGFYPVLFPVFLLASAYVLLKGKTSILLFLSVVFSSLLCLEYTLSAYWREGYYFDFHVEMLPVTLAVFILFYPLARWLDDCVMVKARDYGAILGLWTMRFGIGFMLVMSFAEPWEAFIEARWNHIPSALFVVAVFLVGSFLLAKKSNTVATVIAIIAFYLLTFAGVLSVSEPKYALVFQVLYNFILIAASVLLIVKGVNKGISHYFFLGVLSILVTAFLRYLDLVGSYIGAAVLFILFACVLLGAAYYWKNVHFSKEAI